MDIFQPLDEVVAFLHLCREVHIDLVDFLCLVIGLRREGVLKRRGREILEVFFVVIRPYGEAVAADGIHRAVRLGDLKLPRCRDRLAVFVRLHRDTDCVGIEVFGNSIRTDFIVESGALIPLDFLDMIRCAVRNPDGVKVKLLADDRRLDPADLDAVIIIDDLDSLGDGLAVRALHRECCLTRFSGEHDIRPVAALRILHQRCDLVVCYSVVAEIVADCGIRGKYIECVDAVIILAVQNIRALELLNLSTGAINLLRLDHIPELFKIIRIEREFTGRRFAFQ